MPPIAGSLSSPWSRSGGDEAPFNGMLASAPWTRDTEVSQRVCAQPAQGSRFVQKVAGFILVVEEKLVKLSYMHDRV